MKDAQTKGSDAHVHEDSNQANGKPNGSNPP